MFYDICWHNCKENIFYHLDQYIFIYHVNMHNGRMACSPFSHKNHVSHSAAAATTTLVPQTMQRSVLDST